MASQVSASSSPPSAHVVGNLFVEQYYPILHHKPEEVHKFYQDSSVLSRPDLDGIMTSVTTMQAIDEKVMSLDYKSYKVKIETVDAQHSFKDGVVVLVTGCLTGKDNITRKFTQSFFLAPQEKGGYFVLNDVFRYVADIQPKENDYMLINEANAVVPNAPPTPDPEPTAVHVHVSDPVTLPENSKNGDEALNHTENGTPPAEEALVPPVHSSLNDPLTPEVTNAVAQEDAPKKSYASIVKVMKGNTASPVVPKRVVAVKMEKQPVVSAPAPPLETPVPESSKVPESSDPPEDVEGYSIYIRNLPLNATPSQLEAEFKKFGPIKHGGVQVRNHKQHGYCFGFVEFESLSSMQSAIEASPVTIAGRQAIVEEKRTTTRVGGSNGSGITGGRGRFHPARGGFRSDSFRGRGGFGGQGYGRSEFRNRGEFSNRGRGSGGRATESYQRVGRPTVEETSSAA